MCNISNEIYLFWERRYVWHCVARSVYCRQSMHDMYCWQSIAGLILQDKYCKLCIESSATGCAVSPVPAGSVLCQQAVSCSTRQCPVPPGSVLCNHAVSCSSRQCPVPPGSVLCHQAVRHLWTSHGQTFPSYRPLYVRIIRQSELTLCGLRVYTGPTAARAIAVYNNTTTQKEWHRERERQGRRDRERTAQPLILLPHWFVPSSLRTLFLI